VEIDDRTEPLVREALAAAVGQDPERFRGAVRAFPDDDAMTRGVQLACALALFVLDDLFEGRRPTEEEIRSLAGDVATSEDWADVTLDEVAAFFVAGYDRISAEAVLPLERVLILCYVVAANLLSSYHEDGEEWWEYLDRAEAAIEARPAG
jgi:hypothetical protein